MQLVLDHFEKRVFICFFFNDTATTEIYTLSLHDALPICELSPSPVMSSKLSPTAPAAIIALDRKSTRLNSSHRNISYAVFCLQKKKQTQHSEHDPISAHILRRGAQIVLRA